MDPSLASPIAYSADFAKLLRMTKKDWLSQGPEGEVIQAGAAYVGARIEVPTFEGSKLRGEAAIETFLVDSEGRCTSTGGNAELIDYFLPAVAEMADRVLRALAEFGVTIETPAYLTVSTTPLAAVTTTPHFDDDQYAEDAGVGVVAIAANMAGPRIACTPVPYGSIRPSLPIALDAQVADDFQIGLLSSQQAEANRIVLFPQFAQLHAGPSLATGESSSAIRSLLVLRAATTPG